MTHRFSSDRSNEGQTSDDENFDPAINREWEATNGEPACWGFSPAFARKAITNRLEFTAKAHAVVKNDCENILGHRFDEFGRPIKDDNSSRHRYQRPTIHEDSETESNALHDIDSSSTWSEGRDDALIMTAQSPAHVRAAANQPTRDHRLGGTYHEATSSSAASAAAMPTTSRTEGYQPTHTYRHEIRGGAYQTPIITRDTPKNSVFPGLCSLLTVCLLGIIVYLALHNGKVSPWIYLKPTPTPVPVPPIEVEPAPEPVPEPVIEPEPVPSPLPEPVIPEELYSDINDLKSKLSSLETKLGTVDTLSDKIQTIDGRVDSVSTFAQKTEAKASQVQSKLDNRDSKYPFSVYDANLGRLVRRRSKDFRDEPKLLNRRENDASNQAMALDPRSKTVDLFSVFGYDTPETVGVNDAYFLLTSEFNKFLEIELIGSSVPTAVEYMHINRQRLDGIITTDCAPQSITIFGGEKEWSDDKWFENMIGSSGFSDSDTFTSIGINDNRDTYSRLRIRFETTIDTPYICVYRLFVRG